MSITSLKGKKLLILVGGPNLISLVERAKELGIYTIVTDYYDTEESPAKLIADEYWNISWADIDALEAKCREEHIDGVTTGYSESPVGSCIQLCERLGLPCYCTEEQLALTKDKILFKNECRKSGVPVVNEYSSIDDVDTFPVIVKPADRAGSIGVGVASNKEELQKAYAYAMEKSYCKKVVIEDYIADGSKFDVTYAICNGKAILLSDSDTINAQDNGLDRVVQSGWLFPSKYHAAFLKKADRSIKKMISRLGIKDGYIFYSGFAIEKNEDVDFVFFETGFRLSGGHMYRYMQEKGVVNVLDIFISHALTGSTDLVEWNNDCNPDLKCAMINYYAKSGIVTEMSGAETIQKNEDCTLYLPLIRIGEKCDTSHAILTKVCMFHFCNTSPLQLSKDVDMANNTISVKNQNGEDMVYDRIEPSIIANWWD